MTLEIAEVVGFRCFKFDVVVTVFGTDLLAVGRESEQELLLGLPLRLEVEFA